MMLRRYKAAVTKAKKRSLVTSVIAGILALFWMAAGVAVVLVKSEKRGAWMLYLLSPCAFAYGVVWILVMLHGRQLKSGETVSGMRALLKLDFDYFKGQD